MCKFCPFDDQEQLMYGAFVTGLHWLQISISLAMGMKCKFTSRVGKRSLYYNILRVSDKLFCAIVMWNVVFYCCHLTLWVFHSPQVLTFHPSLFPPNRPWVCNILCLCLLLLCCVISKSCKGQNLHQGWAHTQRAHSPAAACGCRSDVWDINSAVPSDALESHWWAPRDQSSLFRSLWGGSADLINCRECWLHHRNPIMLIVHHGGVKLNPTV